MKKKKAILSVMIVLCIISSIAFSGELPINTDNSKPNNDYKIKGLLPIVHATIRGGLGLYAGAFLGSLDYVIVDLLGVSFQDSYYISIPLVVTSVFCISYGTALGICGSTKLPPLQSDKKRKIRNATIGSFVGLLAGYGYGVWTDAELQTIGYAMIGSIAVGILGYNLTKVSASGNAVLNINKESISVSLPLIYLTRSHYKAKALTLNMRLLQVNF